MTGVQTCALPIYRSGRHQDGPGAGDVPSAVAAADGEPGNADVQHQSGPLSANFVSLCTSLVLNSTKLSVIQKQGNVMGEFVGPAFQFCPCGRSYSPAHSHQSVPLTQVGFPLPSASMPFVAVGGDHNELRWIRKIRTRQELPFLIDTDLSIG